MSAMLNTLINIWPKVSEAIAVPHNKAQYNKAIAMLDELTDQVGEDEDHPLASLMELLSVMIESYEYEHLKEPKGDPITSLKILMEEHELSQKDLSVIGSQGVVSEILSRKRSINARQAKALAKRFHVSPTVFL